MPTLEILLLSPLAAGSGAGRAGSVDREVPYDNETGIPYLSGKTLKGLLRGAYLEITSSGAFPELPAPDDLFGVTAAAQPGPLSFTSAQPAGLAEAAPWWRALARGGMIRAVEILRQFTETRRQTRISRRSGAPLEDTLRSVRVLRAGLALECSIAIDAPSGDRDRLLLALAMAALNLRRAGSSRNRGYGSVRCRLVADGKDFTEWATSLLTGNQEFPLAVPAPDGAIARPLPPAPTLDSVTLRYRLTLSDPVLLVSSRQFNPNTATATDVISGSVLRGLAAWRFRREYGAEANFHQHFTESGSAASFGDALPVDESVVSSRLPNSLREEKQRPHSFVDLAELRNSEYPDGGLRRHSGFIVPVRGGKNSLARVEVRKVFSSHHQRSRDQRLQRAVGSEEKSRDPYGLAAGEEGALFSAEAIAAGQQFEGVLQCTPDFATILQQLLPDGEQFSIGRSRRAQFGGGAILTWVPSATGSEKPVCTPEGYWIADLVSPLIGWNAHGHPGPFFPADALGNGVSIVKAFCRPEPTGGYNSHQNLPRPRNTALAAGSVFVLRAPDDFDWAAAEIRRYGLRTPEGFGQIRFRRASFNTLRDADDKLFPSQPARPSFQAPPEVPSATVQGPLLRIWRERILDHILRGAFAERKPTSPGSISRQLLHQFINSLTDPGQGLANLQHLLNNIPKKAARHLESCRFHNSQNLKEVLLGDIHDPNSALLRLVRNLPDGNELGWQKAFGGRSPVDLLLADASFVNEAVRLYLIEYLSQFARDRSKAARDEK